MSNPSMRGELLLNQTEFNQFVKDLEKVCLEQYGLESSRIPWRLHPIDQTIRTHTPSSISLAAALRELDATVDPSLLFNQPLHRRSSIKHETTVSQSAAAPPSPTPPPAPVVEVKDEPRHKVVDEKVHFDPHSEMYKLLHPGHEKLKYLPEWAKSIHKILKEICYQPFCKPFLKYFKKTDDNEVNTSTSTSSKNKVVNDDLDSDRKSKDNEKDDLDFDDMSDDLHDILMDLDQPDDSISSNTNNKDNTNNNDNNTNDNNNNLVDQKVKQENDNELKDVNMDSNEGLDKLDNYVKVENNDTSGNTSQKSASEEPVVKVDVEMDGTNMDKDTNKKDKNKESKESKNDKQDKQENKEQKDKEKLDNKNLEKDEQEGKDKEKEDKTEVTLEYVLENLLSNKYENSSKVFSLVYGFLVDQFKGLSPGSYDWMCAQDVSNKLDQLRVNRGLNDAEWLTSQNNEHTSQPLVSPVTSVGQSVQFVPETPQSLIPEPKKPRTSMEDFEHELALINNVDEHTPTISLPEVKNITDQERTEFYENAVLLDPEYQLELFTVFEHAAVWKLVGNGEIELDDQNTDPKIYRGMIKWVKEKSSTSRNGVKDKTLNLSHVSSEITV